MKKRLTNTEYASTREFLKLCQSIPAVKPCKSCANCQSSISHHRSPSAANCIATHLAPTPRQASKYRNGKGIIWKFHNNMI
jgi:hypothetical protein